MLKLGVGYNFNFCILFWQQSGSRFIQRNSAKFIMPLCKIQRLRASTSSAENVIQDLRNILNQKPIDIKDISDQVYKKLNELNNNVAIMNLNEISNYLIILSQLRYKAEDKTVKEVLNRINEIAEGDKHTLENLEKFTEIVKLTKITSTPVAYRILDDITHKLKISNDVNEFAQISQCLKNLNSLVSDEMFQLYQNKLGEFFKNDSIRTISTAQMLSICEFLSNSRWSHKMSANIRRLLILVNMQLNQISTNELEKIYKFFQKIQEPAEILPNLLAAAKQHYLSEEALNALTFILKYNQIDKDHFNKEATKKLKMELADKNTLQKLIKPLYKLLRISKIANLKIYDEYWTKILVEINSQEKCQDHNQLVKHCHRYMFFNNNLGGTFRHLEYESQIGNSIMQALSNNTFERETNVLSNFFSFLIAYGLKDTGGIIKIPESIIIILENNKNSLTLSDCLNLSKGIQIAVELRLKFKLSRTEAVKLNQIKEVIKIRLNELFDTVDFNLDQINMAMRCLNNIKVDTTSKIFSKLLTLYKNNNEISSSRQIRDVAYNFLTSDYLIPDIITQCFDYVEENRNYVLGETVDKLLQTAYTLAYTPQTDDGLISSADIVKRDFDYMTTISIINSCMALSYYRLLSADLIHKVFSDNFIKRIQNDIDACYSKQTFPNRILNLVMQLNRTICLDYPELQFPWFQQNYIEAQLSKQSKTKTKFYSEIEDVLHSVIEDKNTIFCNQTTSYGYHIDFIVNIDNKKKLLTSHENTLGSFSVLRKFAILLMTKNDYCNNENEIKGIQQIRIRHLEMLGFNVITINMRDWNALHMSISGAKALFLKKLLQLNQ